MSEASRMRGLVYAGLGYPDGVILARREGSAKRLNPGSNIVLVGDEHACGIAQFLGRLACDAKVNLRFEWQRGQLFENWFSADRAEQLVAREPSLVLFAFNAKSDSPEGIQGRLKELRRYVGNTDLRWVLPLTSDSCSLALSLALGAEGIRSLHSESLSIHRSPTGAPSARGYAGWAGAVWGWIR